MALFSWTWHGRGGSHRNHHSWWSRSNHVSCSPRESLEAVTSEFCSSDVQFVLRRLRLVSLIFRSHPCLPFLCMPDKAYTMPQIPVLTPHQSPEHFKWNFRLWAGVEWRGELPRTGPASAWPRVMWPCLFLPVLPSLVSRANSKHHLIINASVGNCEWPGRFYFTQPWYCHHT